jgi:hypothetical protein
MEVGAWHLNPTLTTMESCLEQLQCWLRARVSEYQTARFESLPRDGFIICKEAKPQQSINLRSICDTCSRPPSFTSEHLRSPCQPANQTTKLTALFYKTEQNNRVKLQNKTYNTRDSPVVTHPSTNLVIIGLSMGERTGSRVLRCLWSYVTVLALDWYM